MEINNEKITFNRPEGFTDGDTCKCGRGPIPLYLNKPIYYPGICVLCYEKGEEAKAEEHQKRRERICREYEEAQAEIRKNAEQERQTRSWMRR
jgi:hypothetical protein